MKDLIKLDIVIFKKNDQDTRVKHVFLNEKGKKIFNEDGNYLINHSSSVLLLKDGKYLDRINHHAKYKDMFKVIDKYLR